MCMLTLKKEVHITYKSNKNTLMLKDEKLYLYYASSYSKAVSGPVLGISDKSLDWAVSESLSSIQKDSCSELRSHLLLPSLGSSWEVICRNSHRVKVQEPGNSSSAHGCKHPSDG